VRQAYRPTEVAEARYYEPTTFGEEKIIGQRLAWWRDRLAR